MSKVYIFFADGFEDIEGLTVVDLMRRAGIDIQTVSIKETKEIKTSHGIHLLTDRTFGECDFSDADMLVIPGGMRNKISRGIQTADRSSHRFLPERRKSGCYLCRTGSIRETWLPEGQKCYFLSICDGAAYKRKNILEPVVVDGNVTTSRGLGTAIDFSLSLIRQLEGRAKAEEIAESVVYSTEIFY